MKTVETNEMFKILLKVLKSYIKTTNNKLHKFIKEKKVLGNWIRTINLN